MDLCGWSLCLRQPQAIIPTLGTKHSQCGNISFPHWEYVNVIRGNYKVTFFFACGAARLCRLARPRIRITVKETRIFREFINSWFILASQRCYAHFDAKRATSAVLDKAMNNFRFSLFCGHHIFGDITYIRITIIETVTVAIGIHQINSIFFFPFFSFIFRNGFKQIIPLEQFVENRWENLGKELVVKMGISLFENGH